MANIRDLKKEVRYVCGDLAAECLMARTFIKGVDRERMEEIVGDIAALQETALSRITFSFDKIPSDFASGREYRAARRAYFKKAYKSFREKFEGHVNDIVREMNAALPQEVKDANKKK